MGGKTSTTTQPTFQTQTSTPSPQAMQAYQTALDRAEASANIPFQTYSMDPNAFVAPLNSTQTGAIQNITNQQGATNNAFNAAYGQTAQGSVPTYNTVGNYMSPYLNAVAAPTLQYLQQQQGQDLAKQQADAIMHGAYGGDRAGIQRSVLQGQQGLAQAQTLGNILNQGYNTALGAAQQGANQALAAGNQFGNLGVAQQNAALAQGQAQLGAGTAAQQTEQAGKSALYNQFLQYVAYPFQTTQFLANVAGGLGPLTGSTSTGFGMQQTTSPQSFFSDRRLKHNAKKVGELHDGQPVYKYDYGDGRTQLGLMAQDVEKDHPEAVGLHPSGFKMVDYDSATRDAERPGKAGGGGLSGDIASILAAQAQFLPGQKGQGAGAGYVPQSSGLRPGSMSAPQLNLAPSKAQQQQSGLGQAAGAMKELSGLGSGIKGAYQSAKDLYAKATDAGAGAPASTDLEATDFSKAPMPPERPSDLPDFSAAGDFATGGLIPRHGFAMGGLPGDDNSTGPSYFPDQVLDEGAKSDMATALKAPQLNLTPSGGGGKSGGSEAQGLGSLLGGAGSAMSGMAAILPFLLARGGRVGKTGGGGLLPDVMPDDSDLPPDAGDYSAILPDSELPKFNGLDPTFAPRLQRFLQDNPKPIGLTSGFRTPEEQAALYKAKPNLAAPPGHSQHEMGLAGDLNFYGDDEARDWAHANASAYGLKFPMLGKGPSGKNEPWHVEPAGKPTQLAYAPDTRTASDALPPGAGFASGSPASSDEGGLGSALSSAGGWFDKNQNWLVPLLTGIGTMASSPSRYLGSAILQGLGGGAQAYARQQLQQSQITKNTLPFMLQLRQINTGRAMAGLAPISMSDLTSGKTIPYAGGAGLAGGASAPTTATAGVAPSPTVSSAKAITASPPPVIGPATNAPAQTASAPTGPALPPPDSDFWNGVDPNDNPQYLAQQRQLALANGDLQHAAQLQNERAAIMTRGTVMKNGQAVPLPGFAEAAARAGAQKVHAEEAAKLGPDITQAQAAAAAQKRKAEEEASPNIQSEIQSRRANQFEQQFIPGLGQMVYDKANPQHGWHKPGSVPTDLNGATAQPAPAPAPSIQPAKGGPNWKPTLNIPEGYAPPGQENMLNKDFADKERQIAEGQLKESREKAVMNDQVLYRLGEMDHQFAQMPQTGFLTPGTHATERTAFAKSINTTLSMMGAKPMFDPNNVAAAENLGKDTFRLGAELSRQIGGREPGFIVQQAVSANPGIENTPMAYRRIVSGLRESAKYEIDRAQFRDAYWSKFGTLNGADDMFRQMNPPQRYVDRAIVSTLPPKAIAHLQSHPDTAADFDRTYGRGTAHVVLGE